MTASPRTILYIEDDPASRYLLERALTHAGYRVLVAERGIEGIDIARDSLPDLILTDLNLPDLTGREVTTILRCDSRFQSTPIVAVTAHGPDQRDTALAAGLTGYVTKPLDVETLPRLIEYYLGGGHEELDAQQMSEAQATYTREVVVRLESRIRELEAANIALSRLDDMKDNFIQLTAHELRTPLTLVYGYSRLLEDYPPLKKLMQSDNNIYGLVHGLSEAIERMRSIIDEILTISRIMTNQIDLSLGPTNLGVVVRKILQQYDVVFRERRLTVHFDQAMWPQAMRADGELLKVALNNLISNAIKYTPDGGRIYITSQTNNDYVRVTVRDTGIGIAKADQSQLFERFNTTRDVQFHSTSKTAFGGGGLGLGLPISKGIVEAHGGRLWVESPGYDPEQCPGSEFTMVLPLVVQAPKSKVQRIGQ